jgi:hypothetical protein
MKEIIILLTITKRYWEATQHKKKKKKDEKDEKKTQTLNLTLFLLVVCAG